LCIAKHEWPEIEKNAGNEPTLLGYSSFRSEPSPQVKKKGIAFYGERHHDFDLVNFSLNKLLPNSENDENKHLNWKPLLK